MLVRSYIKINLVDLKPLKGLLFDEGFYDPWFAQKWKDGQIFGLAKELDAPFEWHVRAFKDGCLESEIEISRRYIGHQSVPAKPFHGALIEILSEHGTQFEFTDTLPPDPEEMTVPSTLVDWLPLAASLFSPVLYLCNAFKEKTKRNSENGEREFQVNFRGLRLAALILSVPLRIVASILLMIPARARFNIFSILRRLVMIKPPQLTFIDSISTLKGEEKQKLLFRKFIDELNIEKLAEL
jgi:hypothetical protein